MEKEKQFRPLHIPVNKPRRLYSLFWWLAGIALAVLFLTCVAISYYTHHTS